MAEMKKMVGVRFLPALMVVALVCIGVATAVVLFFGGETSTSAQQVRQINALLALSYKIPAEATNALSGNEAAFDALERDRLRYSTLAESLGQQVQGLSASQELLKQTQTILLVREPTLTLTRSASEVRELLPQLLSAMSNVLGAVGPGGVESMTRALERFEASGFRVQQDLQALASGVDDPTAIIRRAGDSVDFMGQVIGGLAGEDSGLGLQRVSGAEAEAKLKTASELYGRLSTSVRSALSSADRVQ